MNELTPFARALAGPQWCAELSAFLQGWVDRTVTLRLTGEALPDAQQTGGHLRRSFLGALGPGASEAARTNTPCTWDPPCALDVFQREQLRRGGAGLPKPYTLSAARDGADLLVSLRVFGMANDWGAAAADALVRGVREVLPWDRLGAWNVVVADRAEEWFIARDLPHVRDARLALVTPVDVSANDPVEAPARLPVRALYRVDAIGRWCGVALEPAELKRLQDALHGAGFHWVSQPEHGRYASPNRKGQARKGATLTGVLGVCGMSREVSDLLHLVERTGIGRKTNEGLGQLKVLPD